MIDLLTATDHHGKPYFTKVEVYSLIAMHGLLSNPSVVNRQNDLGMDHVDIPDYLHAKACRIGAEQLSMNRKIQDELDTEEDA